ncbi:MAG: Biotin carboxyl carrier protein of acetyl-CoA carboxylase [Chroococcopsis gigantea SAG 12.99]|jgi:acetyl-CoA carboxylase biotin carboxyl carrier protein|nr:Biotin carboxyl carrier protein of acetyl-CoA carboxylase [Chroococcopsis gigantea SAG 12.99]
MRLVSINYNELRELLKTIGQTDITEFILKSEELELTVRKATSVITPVSVVAAPETLITPQGATNVAPPPAIAPEPVASTPAAPVIDKKWVAVTSPMVGTFYRAPAPSEPSFVEVNDKIRTGQTVCIIEAMKLMNEIESEVSGQIMEILVTNGEPVEFGQNLMWVNPD